MKLQWEWSCRSTRVTVGVSRSARRFSIDQRRSTYPFVKAINDALRILLVESLNNLFIWNVVDEAKDDGG